MLWELDVRGAAGSVAKAVVGSGARVGRAPSCDVVLNHASVSRVHARVEEREGRLWLVDAGSRNGLLVQGERTAAVRLADGIEFQLGELRVRVQRVAAVQSSGAPLEFAQDVKALLERTAFRKADGPLLEDAALEDPAAIQFGAPPPGGSARASVDPARAAAGSRAVPPSQQRRAELLVPKRSSNPLFGELGQHSLWVQAIAWIAVPGVLALAGWGAFRLVELLTR